MELAASSRIGMSRRNLIGSLLCGRCNQRGLSGRDSQSYLYFLCDWKLKKEVKPSGDQLHQSGGWQVGNQETSPGERLSGEITAADCAFHGRGPSGIRPITGEKNTRPGRLCFGTIRVDAWF